MAEHTVGRLEDLDLNRGRMVLLEDRWVGVFRTSSDVAAIQGECPHLGGPLGEGFVRDGRIVVCPWHEWKFDLHTGRGVVNPAVRVERYPVRVVDGEVLVTVPPA